MSEPMFVMPALDLQSVTKAEFAEVFMRDIFGKRLPSLAIKWGHVLQYYGTCPWCGRVARYTISGQLSSGEDAAPCDLLFVITSCQDCYAEIVWNARLKQEEFVIVPVMAYSRLPLNGIEDVVSFGEPASVSKTLGASATETE